jgi:hypothetical protein
MEIRDRLRIVIPKTGEKHKGMPKVGNGFHDRAVWGKVAASQRTGSVGGVWSALADRLCATCKVILSQGAAKSNHKMISFWKIILKIASDLLSLRQNPLTKT